MRNWIKFLVFIIFVSIITGVGIYLSLNYSLNREEYVTGDAWATSLWRVEGPSYAEFKNGSFSALAYQPSSDFFGACLIQQGDNPHGEWNPSEKLNKNITIYKSDRFNSITFTFPINFPLSMTFMAINIIEFSSDEIF